MLNLMKIILDASWIIDKDVYMEMLNISGIAFLNQKIQQVA